MITVRQAMSIGELGRAVLAAGERGLDRPIKYVDIMEVPDVTGWLRPHEFLITCAYALKDDPEGQVRLIRQLAAEDAAALAVKSSRFLGSMPQRMIAAADEVGLPLINIPADVPFIDITHPLLSAILNEEVQALHRTTDVQQRLAKLLLEGTGLDPVVRELGRMLNRHVHVLDSDRQMLATTEEGALSRGPRSGVDVLPVVGAGTLIGTLLVEPGAAGPLSEAERAWAEQAATAVGLEMLRLRAIRETEFRLRSDFLSEVLKGEALSAEASAAKARMLGIELDQTYSLLVVSVEGEACASDRARLPVSLVRQEAERANLSLFALQYEGRPVCIVAGARAPASGTVEAQADRFAQACRLARVPVSLGISEQVTGAGSLALAYAQASRALDLGRAVYGPGKAVSYTSLAPYLLLQKLDAKALAAFAQSVLGELYSEDGVFTDTLRAFLECGGELKPTAEKLFIHRNTLDYRLRRIEEILHCDVRDPETRFTLRLAMAAMILSRPCPA